MPGAVRRTLADPPHITPVHCVKETLPDALTGVKAFALPTLLGIFSFGTRLGARECLSSGHRLKRWDAVDETHIETVSPPFVVLPGWVSSVIDLLWLMLCGISWLFSLVAGLALAHYFTTKFEFLGFALVPVIWLATVWVHEYGHVLGGRAVGMTPHLMQVGPLLLWKQRWGWRLQWHRKRRDYGGLTMAFINPDIDYRQQQMVMTIGGPAANLLVAMIMGWGALYIEERDMDGFLWGLAVLNLAMALANLLPKRGTLASDGMLLLDLYKGIDEESPEFLIAHLNGLSVKGTTADKLPVDILAKLESQPAPYPLFQTWYVVKGLQNRNEWAQVVALEPLVEDRISKLSPELEMAMSELAAQMRCEIAFSKVMTGQKLDHTIDQALTMNSDWSNPGLRARCHALMAVRQGNEALARSLLEKSRRSVSRSIDLALHASEASIRRAITLQITSA